MTSSESSSCDDSSDDYIPEVENKRRSIGRRVLCTDSNTKLKRVSNNRRQSISDGRSKMSVDKKNRGALTNPEVKYEEDFASTQRSNCVDDSEELGKVTNNKKRCGSKKKSLVPLKKVKEEVKNEEMEGLLGEGEEVGNSQIKNNEELITSSDNEIDDIFNDEEKPGPSKKISKLSKRRAKKEEIETSSDDDDWEDVDLEEDLITINLNGKTLDPAEERKKRLAIMKRKENLEKKKKIKGEHVKAIVDVLEGMCRGFTVFKNHSTDHHDVIKKVMKLKGNSLENKMKNFLNNIDSYIKNLEGKVATPIACPSEMEEEYKKVFYSFIALNIIEVNCRVCSPCNPPSLLLNVKRPKLEGEKRYFFIEVLNKEKNDWIPIDIMTGDFKTLEADAFNDPNFLYMFSIDFNGVFRDVTGRYTDLFISHKFRQSRMPNDFIRGTFKIYNEGETTDPFFDDLENTLLLKNLEKQGFPDNITDFKGHPLYCLDKDVLKTEAIWPPETKPIGKVGKYNVYLRESIKQLYTSIKLLMRGLDVKKNEKPIKIIGRIPRASDGPDRPDPTKKPLYGEWQAEMYKTPKLVDDRIVPNKYGNIYVFQPWMVPENCIHMRGYTDYKKYADEIDIQVVPAVVGFETKKGFTYPLCDGFIVKEKDANTLTTYLSQNHEKIEKVKKKREASKAKKQIERQINHANMYGLS